MTNDIRFYGQANRDRGLVAAVLLVAGFEVRREILTLDQARDLHARLGRAITDAEAIDAVAQRTGKSL